MRVLHGSTAFDIKAVLPDETRKTHVDLVCEVVK
jgi:head-tail adaptor